MLVIGAAPFGDRFGERKNVPAIQKCRTCVQPYRRDRYTGTHVRLFSLDSLFLFGDSNGHGHTSFALFWTVHPESIYEGNANRLRNWAILQFEREEGCDNCKNARDRTTSVWNFRGDEIARKSVFVYPCSASEPLFCTKRLSPWETFRTKKPVGNCTFKGHGFRPTLAFRTAAQWALFSAHCDTYIDFAKQNRVPKAGVLPSFGILPGEGANMGHSVRIAAPQSASGTFSPSV